MKIKQVFKLNTTHLLPRRICVLSAELVECDQIAIEYLYRKDSPARKVAVKSVDTDSTLPIEFDLLTLPVPATADGAQYFLGRFRVGLNMDFDVVSAEEIGDD